MIARRALIGAAGLTAEIAGFVLVARIDLGAAVGVALMFLGWALNRRLQRERETPPRVELSIDHQTRWEDTVRELAERLRDREAVTIELRRRNL